MARRSFSLMLAWRYLNPRRAMLSAVTIISVLGVLLGVWILVVVMSVYNGMEEQVKKRLLGFTPHVKLEYAPFGGFREPIGEWRQIADSVAEKPGVESATAFVQDYVWLDSEGLGRPAVFRAIDTGNPGQVASITGMLALEDHPGSTADMGLDNRVVISSIIATQLGLTAGDTLNLYSMRNFEEAKRTADKTNRPPARELLRAPLDEARKRLGKEWEKRDAGFFLPAEEFHQLYEVVYDAFRENSDDIRDPEAEILGRFFEPMDDAPETEGGFLLADDAKETMLGALDELEKTDVKEMDHDILDGMRELVLPKEALIAGVYQASQMMVMPDIFTPLPLAQELAGLKGAVQGIAVRLENPDRAGPVAGEMLAELPGWQASTWATEFGDFANIINQQRVMMYIVLGMIIVISAFSMMAVMFTVTIQKRREIGVLKALGAAPGQIVRIFVIQGVILGVVGALLGVGLGLLMLHFRGHIQQALRAVHFDPFPASFNGFEILPSVVVPMEVLLIAVSAFLLCSFAAFVPAFGAARNDAARSLRNL